VLYSPYYQKNNEGAQNLRNKLASILLIVLLTTTTIYLTNILAANAATGQGDWITQYTITDAKTGNLILDKNFATNTVSGSGQISSGAELKVTVHITIPTNNPSSSLTLSTAMAHSSKDHYWEHDASDGYALGNYNPNSASFSFSQTSGTLIITVYGIASGTVATTAGGVTIHKSVPVSLVALKDPSSTVLDEIKPNITDASIDTYNIKLKEEQDKVAGYSSSGVSPATVQAFNNIITQSQVLAASGLTDGATEMLKALDTSVAPASATMEILFIPLVAIFAVIAGVFGFMFMRSRSKVGYYKLVVEDQIKDLEGISLKASRLDKGMGANLESVKDRLKRLVGM
jgi:hypothetical protein